MNLISIREEFPKPESDIVLTDGKMFVKGKYCDLSDEWEEREPEFLYPLMDGMTKATHWIYPNEMRGLKVTAKQDILTEDGKKVRIKKGQSVTIISQYSDYNDSVSVRVPDKHYPFHNIPIALLTPAQAD